ncbi:MAG: DUF2961 domain-containing protein [Planctomycetes bacterium]|nr:DUF2961 domain-containing protein [Planctomycetota bacterium]
MVRTLAWIAALGCAAIASARAQVPARPDSVARLIDLAGLPLATPGVTCRQFASTDPTGHGEDHGHFLRREGSTAVLAEMDGPGVVVRLWSANAAGRLRVFLDGETGPRLDCPFDGLFDGSVPPFEPPIAIHEGGGFVSYFPIAYARSCRIEVGELEHPEALYYHVQYLTYPAGTTLRTFTRELPPEEHAALRDVLALWRAPGRSPIPPEPTDRTATIRALLGPGAERTVLDSDRPGTLLTLRIDPADHDASALRELRLIARWDGCEPSVQVPIGDLFGVAFGAHPSRGLALGWDEHGGYCHLPMPFHHGARVTIHNAGSIERAVTFATTLRPEPPDPRAGTLHAEFRETDGVGDALYELASVRGPGKLVGVLQALQGVGDLWYLEGNEELSVDGASTPSIVGTGTEDFYNGGWYWSSGPFAMPLHGLGVKQEWTTNRTTPWRLLLPDAVPFETGLVARIEHGSENAVRDAYYSSVALWYGPPQPVRPLAPDVARVPRRWVVRPAGSIGATALRWAPEPAISWSRWEDLSAVYRGLDRPLFQAFPRSHVEHGAAPLDARLAVLPDGDAAPAARVRFDVAFADRYGAELRLCAAGALPEVTLDGTPVTLREIAIPDGAPLRRLAFDAGALAAGEHELALRRLPGSPDVVAVDSLRLTPAAPFVRAWWISPAIAARPDGTVEDPMPDEERFTADDFDPAAAGWRELATGDVVDLVRAASPQSATLAYLLVFVHSPESRDAHVLLGSDDGVRVWVNGDLRFSHEIHRPLTIDEDQFDIPLRAGWNRILLKVKNDYGGYGVAMRIADPHGDLRYSTSAR